MHKPIVFNRTLNKKWSEINNDIMIHKLNGVKPKIDKKCPESFIFYKTQFRKTANRNNRLREFEIRKDNENMVEKIMNLFIDKKKRPASKPNPGVKREMLSGQRKYEIIKIAQDNQHMLKRLNERTSFYNVRKWEDSYEKTQQYKKNICIFPSIAFHQKGGETSRAASSLNKTKNSGFLSHIHNKEEEKSKNHFLHCGQVVIHGLGNCMVIFATQNKSFVIQVEKMEEPLKIFVIKFDYQDVKLLQKGFAKYDDIASEIKYEEETDRVYIEKILDEDLLSKYSS